MPQEKETKPAPAAQVITPVITFKTLIQFSELILDSGKVAEGQDAVLNTLLSALALERASLFKNGDFSKMQLVREVIAKEAKPPEKKPLLEEGELPVASDPLLLEALMSSQTSLSSEGSVRCCIPVYDLSMRTAYRAVAVLRLERPKGASAFTADEVRLCQVLGSRLSFYLKEMIPLSAHFESVG